jgi:2-polyprenyl-3-methyl-5-hydroxy-6-metoxy-1,4-benzoquinol methylase
MVRKAGFEPLAIAGLYYSPFTRIASLQSSVAVNYLLVCRKDLSIN